MHERVNIVPKAKAYRNEGAFDCPDIPTPLESSYKVEFYAILSVIVDKVIDRALQQRDSYPPFGLINLEWDSFDAKSRVLRIVTEFPPNPFPALKKYMVHTLNAAKLELMDDLEKGGNSPLISVFQRYVQLLSNGSWSPEDPRSPTSKINDGIETASDIMASVLEVIPRVCGDSTFDYIQIAQNSYPLLARLASVHLKTFVSASTKIRDRFAEIPSDFLNETFQPFDTSYFCLEGQERLRLAPSHKLLALLDQDPPLTTPTAGCPALVNFGEGSAIKRLWGWYIDLAPHLYALDQAA